jgi:hypothetical protein
MLGILFIVGLAVFWNSFQVPFVFDDLSTIERNTNVRSGHYQWNLLAARSVLYLTFTLNSAWAGQEVWSYHLVNLLLHLFNTVLVFFIARTVFAKINQHPETVDIAGFLAAAFFLVHPVQTESVTYISSRSELLSTAFYLSAFLIFIRYPETRIGFRLCLLVGILFFLGLGSKETVISLPAAFFLYDYLFIASCRVRTILSRWRFYIPYVIGGAGACYYLLTVALRKTVGAGATSLLPRHEYFLTQLRVIVRYVWLVLCPIGQNLDYDIRPSTTILEPAIIGSALLLAALIVIAWKVRRSAPVLSFSIFWFFVTLAPTSSIIPIADVMFEHRLYLPLAGVCLSFPLALELLISRVRRPGYVI